MALDPTMRRWTIKIQNILHDDDFEYILTLYSDLTKAKAKHLKDGNIDDIELDLTCNRNSRNPEFGACIADNIINHWKNNIVQLNLKLTGYELFLADPTLQLPRLKNLLVDQLYNPYLENVKTIASTFIENQSKSLEFLEMRGIDLEIKKKISLKKLTLVRVTEPSTLESVLNSTNHSLECLELTDIISEAFDCPQLNIKELVCDYIPQSVFHTVTTSCQQTLKTLIIKALPSDEELDVPPLNLTNLAIFRCKSKKNVTSLIKTSCLTLETLKVVDLEDFEMDDNLDIPNLQELKQFEAVEVPAEFVKTIIGSSTNTLTSLKLGDIKEPRNEIIKICEANMMKLKKLQLNSVYPKCLSIINSANHSLEDLEICHINRPGSELDEEIEFRDLLAYKKLEHVRKLKLVNVPLSLVIKLMMISRDTLKDLFLYKIEKEVFFVFSNYYFCLDKFYGNKIDERLMNEILMSSSETLQDITLKNIPCEETLRYNFILPKLKRFTAEGIKFDVVKSVLKSLQSPLEMLSITGGDMDKVSLNSELLTFLLKFGANNPNCFMRMSH